MSRVLIVEDDESINHILRTALKREGLDVRGVNSGKEGLKEVYSFKPQIVLLDVMLPDIDGFDICKNIKDKAYVIMITARDDISDKLYGIELGADDYITKPFDIREVSLRVKAIIRRFEKNVCYEEIYIDEEKRIVKKDGVIIKLNRKEFAVFSLFYNNKNIVFSREKLLDRVWGYEYEGEDRTVDVTIRRLRSKLGETKEKSVIETIFGIGYVMR